MKKTKRILSAITALAITASAFASLVIPASAAETQIGTTYNFESYDVDIAEVKDKDGNTTTPGVVSGVETAFGANKNQLSLTIVEDGTKVVKATASGTGGRSGRITLPETVEATNNEPVKLVFDWYSKTEGAENNTDIIPVDSAGKQIFKFNELASGAISFNGTTISDVTRDWYTISAILDFETKRVITVSITKKGEAEAAATYNDIAFLDSAAANVGGFYVGGNRPSKNTLSVDTRLDNIALYNVTDTYYKVELNIKDKDNQAVSDAAVKLGNTDYVTGADGKVVTKLANGSYNYTVSKIGYVDGSDNATATGTVVVNNAAATENVTYSLKPYTPVVTSATISGGQKAISAPTGSTPAASAAFTVAVKDQNQTDMASGYTTTWAVYPTGTTNANANVTIANGVVSVTKDYKVASGDAAVFDVVATVTDSADNTKTATNKTTIAIANSDVLLYGGETSYTATGGKSVDYDIDDITIPQDGLRISFNYYKGVYDAGKPGQNGKLTFKSGDTTLFYFEDVNSGKEENRDADLALFVDSDNYVYLGNTARGKAYPTELTIIGRQLIVKFNDGDYKVVQFAEAPEKITSINASTTQNGGSGTGATNLVISTKLNVDTNGVNILGDDEFAVIAGKTVTRQYTAKPYVAEASDNFTWSVTEKAGVSIDPATGVLSVEDTATPGKVTVTATSGTKTGSLEVDIEAVQAYKADVTYPNTVEKGKSAKLVVNKITDALGDDVTEYFDPTWSIEGVADTDQLLQYTDLEAGDAVAIFAEYDGTALANVTTQNVTIPSTGALNLVAPAGAKVYIWDSLAGMEPVSADVKTAPAASIGNALAAVGSKSGNLVTNKEAESGTVSVKLNITGRDATPATYSITVADFSKYVTKKDDADKDVDVSDIVTYGTTSFSLVLDDGTVVPKTATDNKISLTTADFGDAEEGEIYPNYKFDLGGASESGYVKVTGTKENGVGFKSAATPAAGTGTGIQSKGVDLNGNSFEVDLPDGRYDMTFYKADTNRTHIRVNEFYTVPEADYTDGNESHTGEGSNKKAAAPDPLTGPGVYTQRDVIVTGGVAKINAYDWSKGVPLMAAVEITKKSDEYQPRKKHIWIAGDSTVTNYRPTPTKDDWEAGKRRTGWGQLFQYYLGDDVIVDDFAHSGDYSVGWYNSTFPSILQYAQPGDYFFVQFGINDRADKNHCPTSLMAEYLGKMVDECRAKGVIPVLITPEICISQYGTVGEHEQSTGSGNAGWFNTNKTVAKEKNVLLIDLADISGKLWATMGKTWVRNNYFLMGDVMGKDSKGNDIVLGDDPQHMSYIGAKLVASMVATDILDQQTAGKRGASGETFNGIPVNAKVQANITYKDYATATYEEEDDELNRPIVKTIETKTLERQAAEFKGPAVD